MVDIRLFGSPEFTFNGTPLLIKRRKSRLLLIYVAAHNQPIRRQQLLPLLWPSLDTQTARTNLRVTLSGLRKQLGTMLTAEQETLSLAPHITVDCHSLTTALQIDINDVNQLDTALNLYRAHFLAELSLGDLPELDDWRQVEQIRYHRLVNQGFIRLSSLYEQQGDYREGLTALSRVLDADPLQEDLQRQALHLHYLAGDRSGAIRRFEIFQQQLLDEMGVPPMDETRAVYDAIILDRYQPKPAQKSDSVIPIEYRSPSQQEVNATRHPFVGRSQELETLVKLSTSGQLILLEGEAGIGKTSLIGTYLNHLRQTERPTPLILMGQARELEAGLPYYPFIEALRSLQSHPHWDNLHTTLNLAPLWKREVARLLPEFGGQDTPQVEEKGTQSELQLWEGIRQLLLALSNQHTLILVLDDLHWADESTLGLLGYCLHNQRAANGKLRFLGATRIVSSGTPLRQRLDSLSRDKHLYRLPLKRLTRTDITTFCQQLYHQQDQDQITWLLAQSEGNPFVLTELVRHLELDQQHNTLTTPSSTEATNNSSQSLVPPAVYTLIRSRLARLSDTAWQVLSAAVVAGREFEFEIIARAVVLSDLNTLTGLEELQALHLIQAQPNLTYRFDHHLTLTVVKQEIGEVRQHLYHRRVGEALEAYHAHHLAAIAGTLATHFEAGHHLEKALAYTLQAGQQAQTVSAWVEAIDFYKKGERLAQRLNDKGTQLETLVSLSNLCIRVGNHHQSAEFSQQALRLLDTLDATGRQALDEAIDEASLYATLVLALVQGARYKTLHTIATTMPDAGLANQITIAFALGVVYGQPGTDLEKAVNHLQTVIKLNERWQALDPEAALTVTFGKEVALFELAQIYAKQGDLVNAVNLYRQGLEATEPNANKLVTDIHLFFYNNLAYHLHLIGDETAQHYAETGLSLARENNILSALPDLLSTNGEIALSLGETALAETYFTEGLSLASQFDLLERFVGITANLGLVAKAKGDIKTALHQLQSALTQADDLNHHYLSSQIRVWLSPLLPSTEAKKQLKHARELAHLQGFQRLLNEIDQDLQG
ncbi:MAG: AAA family ATPase [Chloroflexota bacterium]